MSTMLAPMPVSTPPLPTVVTSPQPKRWTCAEFHELGERGLFEGKRAMLIDGVILEQGPMNPPHAGIVMKVTFVLQALFAPRAYPRVQLPLVLSQRTDPEPDIAIVLGVPDDHLRTHPTSAEIVVEIADSTLAFDVGEKASLYAAGGVADYWVIDVNNRQLLVFRNPHPDASAKHGHSYDAPLTFLPGQSVAPLAAPNSPVAVAGLLP